MRDLPYCKPTAFVQTDFALQRETQWQLQVDFMCWLKMRRPFMQENSSESVHHPLEVAILDRVSQHMLHSNMLLISQIVQCTVFNIAAA